MYFTTLPNHSDPAFNEEQHFSSFNKHNIIFNATVHKSFCADHVGCLSLKTVFEGEEWYRINGAPLAVRKKHFLLLNHAQNYSSHIDSDTPVKSFSIFFKPQFSSVVLNDVLYTERQLIDDPFLHGEPVQFYQKLYEFDNSLQQSISGLIQSFQIAGYSSFLAEEQLTQILHYIIRRHRSEQSNVYKINAIKYSTREEIFHRLNVAKDVLYSLYRQPNLDLETVSRYACISSPQLIRQFRRVFGYTPHQYLTQIRMEKARELLQYTNQNLLDITVAIGLSDVSAFCRLFKMLHKESPGSFRKNFR